MSTPHKHAAIIKAWADGEQIQIYHFNNYRCGATPDTCAGTWEDIGLRGKPIIFCESSFFRVKPKDKEYYLCDLEGNSRSLAKYSRNEIKNLLDVYPKLSYVKVTIDGKTGELKNVEILKQ